MPQSPRHSGKGKFSPSPFRNVLTLGDADGMSLALPQAPLDDNNQGEDSSQQPPPPPNPQDDNSAANHSKNTAVSTDSTQEHNRQPSHGSGTSDSPKQRQPKAILRSRKGGSGGGGNHKHPKRKRRQRAYSKDEIPPTSAWRWLICCRDRTLVRSTLSCMNLVAKMLLWCSAIASAAAVIWYSYELKNNGYVN